MAKILIVDDSPVEIKIICQLFDEEYEVVAATGGKEALQMMAAEKPDLVLLDIIMPEMDGLEVCRILKSQPETADIPVLFITSATQEKDVIRGFEAGGQDYITKPFCSQELCARTRVHLELKKSRETVLEYARAMEAKNRELQEVLSKLENFAMTDYLTSLSNRRFMVNQMKRTLNHIRKIPREAVLVLSDIDDFKKINDVYGHECGDKVLREMSEMISAMAREGDCVARWGGEELLLLLPDTDLTGGMLIAENIRKMVEDKNFRYNDQDITITLTLGVAALDPDAGIDVSIRRADEALYRGKKTSKNCVNLYLSADV